MKQQITCNNCPHRNSFASEFEKDVYNLTHPNKNNHRLHSSVEVFYLEDAQGNRTYHWHEV